MTPGEIKAYKKRYYLENYDKIRESQNQYKIRNREKILAYKKKNRDENQETIKEYRRLWRLKNSEKVKMDKKRYRDEYLKNPINKMATAIRGRVKRAISQKYRKGSGLLLLGCSIEQFVSYIESKFQPGMTWSNYGNKGWHLDHIKPLCSFDLSSLEEQKKACHFTNLQPLWAVDNLKKGKKIVE